MGVEVTKPLPLMPLPDSGSEFGLDLSQENVELSQTRTTVQFDNHQV